MVTLKNLEANQVVQEDSASSLLGLSKFTLRNMRFMRKGPAYIKMGRAVRYRVADLIDYMDARRITPEE